MASRNLNTSKVLEDSSDDDKDMQFQFEKSNEEEDFWWRWDDNHHVMIGDLKCEDSGWWWGRSRCLKKVETCQNMCWFKACILLSDDNFGIEIYDDKKNSSK